MTNTVFVAQNYSVLPAQNRQKAIRLGISISVIIYNARTIEKTEVPMICAQRFRSHDNVASPAKEGDFTEARGGTDGKLAHLICLCAQMLEHLLTRRADGIRTGEYGHR